MKQPYFEKYRCLAALIAAFPNREVIGRTRLQKTVCLLQRLGYPTDYDFTLYHHGPYSEGVQAEIGVLERIGFVTEESRHGKDNDYFVIKADPLASLPEVTDPFRKQLSILVDADLTVLELAATYDAFRDRDTGHEKAVLLTKKKKREKCDNGRLEQALSLLGSIGLSHS